MSQVACSFVVSPAGVAGETNEGRAGTRVDPQRTSSVACCLLVACFVLLPGTWWLVTTANPRRSTSLWPGCRGTGRERQRPPPASRWSELEPGRHQVTEQGRAQLDSVLRIELMLAHRCLRDGQEKVEPYSVSLADAPERFCVLIGSRSA